MCILCKTPFVFSVIGRYQLLFFILFYFLPYHWDMLTDTHPLILYKGFLWMKQYFIYNNKYIFENKDKVYRFYLAVGLFLFFIFFINTFYPEIQLLLSTDSHFQPIFIFLFYFISLETKTELALLNILILGHDIKERITNNCNVGKCAHLFNFSFFFLNKTTWIGSIQMVQTWAAENTLNKTQHALRVL